MSSCTLQLKHVQLEIEARDRGLPTKTSTVLMDIEITKIMNAYPQWIEDYSATPVIISENVKVNHVVARLKATSSMPNSFVNYFIQQGETAEQNGPPRTFYYQTDEKTNQMIIMTYLPLDFETISQYTLTIKAAVSYLFRRVFLWQESRVSFRRLFRGRKL